jgi:3-oxoacyl-[acyl-carrier protein] reductase
MKKILITGSSRGIGKEIAKRLSREGHSVILHGKTLSDKLISFSNEISAEKIAFDLANLDQITEAFGQLGKIDALVNSAGINISKPFDMLSQKDWLDVFNTNFFGLVHLCKLFSELSTDANFEVPLRIINLSSIKGFRNSNGRLAYASSKAALNLFTAGLAKELAPAVLVNAVAPGFTMTEMTESTWTPRIEAQVNRIPLKRMARPDEIAGVVSFLLGPDSSYMTGQTIIVDGGFTVND